MNGAASVAKIDVVIPCYNYGRFLTGCVRSVLEQSVSDLRVLIIDDESSDNSLSVAKDLAAADRRVSVISHARNQGHIKSYNEGIDWANSDYFLLLSADDLLVPGAIDRAIRVMDARADIVMTYGRCVAWFDDLPFPAIDRAPPFTWKRVDLVRDICQSATNVVPTPTAIVRTSVQKAVGGYRPGLPHAGDLEMWLRIAANGGVARVNAVQAIYRKHSSAMSNAYWGDLVAEYEQRKLAFDQFFDGHGASAYRTSRLRQTADRVLADNAFQSGIGYLRRGRAREGLRLLQWAMAADRRLRYFPPLWRLAKIPGAAGRQWAVERLKGAVRKMTERGAVRSS